MYESLCMFSWTKIVPYGGAVAIGGALATAVSNRLLLDDIVVWDILLNA